MNYCFSGGGNPFGARSPFGQNIDPEDILKSFFGERGSPFGFGASSGGFEDFNQVQQVDTRNSGSQAMMMATAMQNWKNTSWNNQNNNFTHDHTFLYISLPSLHDYNMKMPDVTFYGEHEHKEKTFFSFFWYSALEFNSKWEKFAKVWQSKRDGMKAIKYYIKIIL